MRYSNEKATTEVIRQFAIIYIRVSSERQLDNASLETQERVCRDLCIRQGWTVLHVFREAGESAKTANRTQLQASLRYCRENKPRPSYFVVYAVDRFARKGEDHDFLRKLLAGWDIKLRSATQPIGERPMERYMERILSGQAEFDNALRKERALGGMETRLSQGNWTFKAPLGYENVKRNGVKTIVPDSERAPLIQQAFERYATGLYKRQAVLEWVNDKGLRTLSGNRIGTETFRRILNNPLYAGRIVVQGKRDGAGTDWRILEKGGFEPIVPAEIFDKVRALLSGRRLVIAPRKRANPDFPLRHFVRCAYCDRPLTGSKSTSRSGEKYAYYHCQNKKCLSPIRAPKERLEFDFLNYLRQLRPNPDYLRIFRETVVAVYESKLADSLAMRNKLEGELAEKRNSKRKLNEAFVYRHALSESDYRQMKEALEQEIVTLEMKTEDARQDEIEINDLLDFSENLLLNAAATWNQSGL